MQLFKKTILTALLCFGLVSARATECGPREDAIGVARTVFFPAILAGGICFSANEIQKAGQALYKSTSWREVGHGFKVCMESFKVGMKPFGILACGYVLCALLADKIINEAGRNSR